MIVLPIRVAPASSSVCTAQACFAGTGRPVGQSWLPPPVGTGGDPITWKLNYYKDANGIPYESILMVPTAAAGADATPLPLIVVPHGGPHSVTPTSYIASYAYLCLYLGAAVLQVDYMRA